jgi:hypothetical protein
MAFRLGSRDEETFKFDPLAHAVTTIEELHRLNRYGSAELSPLSAPSL